MYIWRAGEPRATRCILDVSMLLLSVKCTGMYVCDDITGMLDPPASDAIRLLSIVYMTGQNCDHIVRSHAYCLVLPVYSTLTLPKEYGNLVATHVENVFSRVLLRGNYRVYESLANV